LIALAALLTLTSCSTTKAFIPTSSIDEVALIEPCGNFVLITPKRNLYSQELSEQASSILTKLIVNSKVPVKEVIPMSYTDQTPERVRWMLSLPDVKPSKANQLVVPKDLCQAVLDKGLKYGMAFMSEGYVKDDNLQATEFGLAAGIAVLSTIFTEDTYIPYTGEPYDTNCYCVIFDARTGEVVYYKNRIKDEYDPRKEAHMKHLINAMFKKF